MTFVKPSDIEAILPGYAEALLADLAKLIAAVPSDQLTIQWDVASEIVALQGNLGPVPEIEDVADALASLLDAIPSEVEAGLHLCYGDYRHQHFADPESLLDQVRLINEVTISTERTIDFVAITVPQHEQREEFFAPLVELEIRPATRLYFALVPYHPDRQAAGTTEAQIELIDEFFDEPWGVCTECGLGRAEREEVPGLIGLHAKIVNGELAAV